MARRLSRILDFIAEVADVVAIANDLDNGRITPEQARRAIARVGRRDERQEHVVEQTAGTTETPVTGHPETVREEHLVA